MNFSSRRDFLQQNLTALAAATLVNSVGLAIEPTPKTEKPVGKKGLGYITKNDKGWEKLKALKVHWFYNWGSTAAAGKPEDIEYVPMIWRGTQAAKVQPRVKTLKDQGHRTLLGFNEPDKKDQANMTVEQALEMWPLLMESGMRLGSPGAAHPDKEWMKEFMAKAMEKKYRVDFVCVHWYWQPDPGDFIGKLKSINKLYDRPLWITEFAVADWDAKPGMPNRYSEAEVAGFVKKVLPTLEKTPWIERYAWFPSGPDSHALGCSALFDQDGKLTKVGEAYAAG